VERSAPFSASLRCAAAEGKSQNPGLRDLALTFGAKEREGRIACRRLLSDVSYKQLRSFAAASVRERNGQCALAKHEQLTESALAMSIARPCDHVAAISHYYQCGYMPVGLTVEARWHRSLSTGRVDT
jgi:hypothetical protein